MSVRRSVRRSWRSETGSTRPIGPVSSPSACSPSRPSAVAASTISNADAAGCSASEPVTADGATGTPARASACGNPAAARGTDLTMTAICDHGTPSKRCARRKKSAISVASAPVEAASFAVTDPESVPVPSISQPPGSRLAMPETTRATAGAQRCEDVSVTDGGEAAPGCGASPPSSAAGSAPRKPNTAWLGSPASSVTSAPAASTRTSRAACGSSCWASSTSRTPIRARSAASSSGSAANASRAAPTSSAAPTAGVVACGAAVPTAARSSITCSYLRANWPAAAHSGRPDRSAQPFQLLGVDAAFGAPGQQLAQLGGKPRGAQGGPQLSGPRCRRIGTVLQLAGEQFGDGRILFCAGDQPGRRTAGALRRQPQHGERVAVHAAHQRLPDDRREPTAHLSPASGRYPHLGPSGPASSARERTDVLRAEQLRRQCATCLRPDPARTRQQQHRFRIGPCGDTRSRDVDQQAALAGSRTAQHSNQPAQIGIEHSAGLRAPAVRHSGMTPRGSDKSARPAMSRRRTGTIDA